jgi:hypothetical protein
VDIFFKVEAKNYVMWLVLISQWFTIGVIVIIGPATAKFEKNGPFCEQPSHDSLPFHRFNGQV